MDRTQTITYERGSLRLKKIRSASGETKFFVNDEEVDLWETNYHQAGNQMIENVSIVRRIPINKKEE